MGSLPAHGDDRELPRERLWSLGPSALTTVELLAILVGTGGGGSTVLEVAGRLLEIGEGSLRRLAQRPPPSCCARTVSGRPRRRGSSPPSSSGLGSRARSGRPCSAIREPEDVLRLFRPAAGSAGGGVPSARARQPEPGAARGAGHPRPAEQLAGASPGGLSRRHRGGRGGHHRGPQPPERRSDTLGGGPGGHPAAGRRPGAAGPSALRPRHHRGRPVRELRRGRALL